MQPRFGRAASDYARHRAGFPESFFARLQAEGVGRPGQRVVDLGTGAGTLARGLARRGAVVLGVDPDAAMIAAARELAAEDGVSVELRVGCAEETGPPESAFQVWPLPFRPTRCRSCTGSSR